MSAVNQQAASTSCGVSTEGQLVGRRKYTLVSEISAGLRRFKHQQDSSWKFIPRKDLLNKISKDYIDKAIPVYGQLDLSLGGMVSREEICEYLLCLPPPVCKEEKTGRKLKGIPVFWCKNAVSNINGRVAKTYTGTTQEFVNRYELCEAHHKRYETHHPDGIGWGGGVASSFECFMDVFNSIMRTSSSMQNAFATTLKVLRSDKFENVDPDGIYFAALHCFSRGVASFTEVRESARWRTRRDVYQLIRDHYSFLSGVPPPSLISSYKMEVNLHQVCVEQEMKRFRKPSPPGRHHDWTKFSSKMVYYYTWYWGIYQQMPKVVQYRALSGCDQLLVDVESQVFEEQEGVNEPTMFSSLLGGVADKAISNSDLIPMLKDLSGNLEDRVDAVLEDVKSTAKQERLEFTHSAEKLLADFKKAIVDKSDELMQKAVDHSNLLFGKLSSIADPITASLNAISSFVDSVVGQLKSYTKTLGLEDVDIGVTDVLSAIKYYLIYINTPSGALRTLCTVMILHSLGILSCGYTWFVQFWSWLSPKVSLNGEEVEAEETSVFDWMADSFPNIVYSCCGVFVSMMKGIAMSRDKFWSMVKQVSETMKSFHFISMGLNGVCKIFEFFTKLFTSLVSWVRANLLGQTPPVVELSKRVSKLIIKTRYLSSEAGIAAIRASRGVREQAACLLPEWVALCEQVRHKRELRHLSIDLDKISRLVKDVADLVTRLKAMSDFQPTMFHLQLVGRPGIGKSTLTRNLANSLNRTLWPEDADAKIYSWNPSLDHFDGYSGQKIMLADDLFRINEPTHLTNLIGIITNTPVILPMANLTDKGIQLTSEVLISSTNTPYPIGKDILCTEALHRRRHILAEVIMDDRVLDRSTGQFSRALFDKYYEGEDPETFPHLKFNLMRPVPDEFSGAAANLEGTDIFDHFAKYAEKLKRANLQIVSQTSEKEETLDPMFYFSEERRPPEGIRLPTTGWSYNEFLSNCVVRFRAFRGMESTYTSRKRYAHAERCLSEIDVLIDQQDDIREGITFPISKLVEDRVYGAQFPYSSEDEIGRRVAEGVAVAPELDGIDFDKLVESILEDHSGDSGVETSDDPVESATGLDETEDERRMRILRQHSRRPRPQSAVNYCPTEEIGGKHYLRVRPNMTMFEDIPLMGQVQSEEELSPRVKRWAEFAQMYITTWKNLESNIRAENRQIPAELLHDMEPVRLGRPHSRVRNSASSPITILWHMFEAGFLNEGQFYKFLVNYVFAKNAVYPDSEVFPAGERGKEFPHSIFFLQHLEKIGTTWYLNLDWLWTENASYQYIKDCRRAEGDGLTFQVKMDPGTLLTHFMPYRLFCMDFDALTSVQQDALVVDAKWRSLYFGSYSYEGMRQQCKGILSKMKYSCLSVLVSPFKFIFETYPQVFFFAFRALMFFVLVYLMYKVGEVFTAAEMRAWEETSKYMHRAGQQKSRVVFKSGSFTSTINVTNFETATQQLLQRHVREVTITGLRRGHTVQAIMAHNCIILNKHAFRDIPDKTFVVSIAFPGQKDDALKFVLDRSSLYEDPDGDLAILYSVKLPASRKLDNWCSRSVLETFELPSSLFSLSRLRGTPTIEHYSNPRRACNIVLKAHDREVGIRDGIIIDGLGLNGMSGSMIVGPGPRGEPMILGIQAWRLTTTTNPQVAVQIITQEKVDELLERVMKQATEKPIIRLAEPASTEVYSLDESAFTSLDSNQVYTQVSEKVGLVANTQFKLSPIAGSMDKVGLTSKRVPAALNPSDLRLYHGRKIHPLTQSLGKYFRGTVEPFHPETLQYCSKGFSSWLGAKLDKKYFRKLSFDEVVTGTREDGSNPMNLGSSPGIPFIFEKGREKKGKRDYLEIAEDGTVSYVDPQFKEGYKKFRSSLFRGELPETRAYDFPKDELRPIGKALGTDTTPPKTRTVTCMNVYYVMLWRELTLDFWASVHRAADGSFPFGPGINPEGPEWSTAYHYLNRFSNAVDFDVSNWDGFLPPDLFEAALEVVMDFTAPVKDSPERLALRAIAYEVMHCYIQYSDMIYQKHRGMVSGFPGTAEMNTLSHLILVIYIYMLLTHNSVELHSLQAFCDNVSFLVYGDDIILTFSDVVRGVFNGKTIAKAYEDIGYPVTSARKDGLIEESRPLRECTFLKSGWTELLPMYYIRVMDMDIAWDLLYWVRAKEHPYEQFMSNAVDALHVVFGHGEAKFKGFVNVLNRCLKENKLPPILWTYDDLYRDYVYRYLRGLSYDDFNIEGYE